jgi:hypothetical protein
MLGRAAAVAKAAGVSGEWVRADAARFMLSGKYDGAICLCCLTELVPAEHVQKIIPICFIIR